MTCVCWTSPHGGPWHRTRRVVRRLKVEVITPDEGRTGQPLTPCSELNAASVVTWLQDGRGRRGVKQMVPEDV